MMKGRAADRLVEAWLPLSEVNLHASLEMAFRGLAARYREEFLRIYNVKHVNLGVGTTLLRNLHPWPARRPTAIARLLTLAAVLPANFNRDLFRRISGLEDIPSLVDQDVLPILLHSNPRREELTDILIKENDKKPEGIVVVDPMAGGGSIPLESLRLGFHTIAIEYNPVAYLILKATLEYPAKFGMKLYHEVRAEVKALINYAMEELSKYYPEDAMNYIIARGYRCWNCRGLIPIIHDVRLGKSGPYIRFNFDKERKTFSVEIASLEPEFERLRCPYCGVSIDRETALRSWVRAHKELLAVALSGDIEEAKKRITMLHETHILLVKRTENGFAPANDLDRKKFELAYLDLAREAQGLKEYIPLDPIPNENEVFRPLKRLGIEHWYELFNPRQLLILALLLKYLINKKLSSGNNHENFVTKIYIIFGFDKLFNFNNITTTWDISTKTVRELMDHYSRTRKIDLGLEYCEAKRIDKALDWVFEPNIEKPTATHGGILPVLRELCCWLEGLGDRVEVSMADARSLSNILKEKSIDVINVDPPYFGQHNYSDISEFFWQLLRIALRPAIERGFFFNTDPDRGRVELHVPGWSPILSIVPREGEIIERKIPIVKEPIRSHTREWYVQEMWKFFKECYKVLKDDGVLIVWFTHSDPEAWEGILSALYAAGFTVTKTWTIRTEMAERRVALAGSAFFSSLALVARKRRNSIVVGSQDIRDLAQSKEVRDAIMAGATDALQSAREAGATEQETYIMALAGAIAAATRVRNPLIESAGPAGDVTLNEFIWKQSHEVEARKFVLLRRFFENVLYPLALYYGTQRVLENAIRMVFRDAGFDEPLVEKLVTDVLTGADTDSKAYLLLWVSTRYSEESLVEYDFVEKICKVTGTTVAKLRTLGFLESKKGRASLYELAYGSRVIDLAKRRTDILMKSAVGSAILLTMAAAAIPRTDTPERLAERLAAERPVSKAAVAIALFLLLTAREDELVRVGIESSSRRFIQDILKAMYER